MDIAYTYQPILTIQPKQSRYLVRTTQNNSVLRRFLKKPDMFGDVSAHTAPALQARLTASPLRRRPNDGNTQYLQYTADDELQLLSTRSLEPIRSITSANGYKLQSCDYSRSDILLSTHRLIHTLVSTAPKRNARTKQAIPSSDNISRVFTPFIACASGVSLRSPLRSATFFRT